MKNLVSWTGWTKEDWRDAIETVAAIGGAVATLCIFFM